MFLYQRCWLIIVRSMNALIKVFINVIVYLKNVLNVTECRRTKTLPLSNWDVQFRSLFYFNAHRFALQIKYCECIENWRCDGDRWVITMNCVRWPTLTTWAVIVKLLLPYFCTEIQIRYYIHVPVAAVDFSINTRIHNQLWLISRKIILFLA